MARLCGSSLLALLAGVALCFVVWGCGDDDHDQLTWLRVAKDQEAFSGRFRPTGRDVEMRAVTVTAGGRLVAGGTDGEEAAFWTSDDGYSWARVDEAGVEFSQHESQRVNGLVAHESMVLAVGEGVVPECDDDGDPLFWYSPDAGDTWSPVPFDFNEHCVPGQAFTRDVALSASPTGTGVVATAVGRATLNGQPRGGVWQSEVGTITVGAFERQVFFPFGPLRAVGGSPASEKVITVLERNHALGDQFAISDAGSGAWSAIVCDKPWSPATGGFQSDTQCPQHRAARSLGVRVVEGSTGPALAVGISGRGGNAIVEGNELVEGFIVNNDGINPNAAVVYLEEKDQTFGFGRGDEANPMDDAVAGWAQSDAPRYVTISQASNDLGTTFGQNAGEIFGGEGSQTIHDAVVHNGIITAVGSDTFPNKSSAAAVWRGERDPAEPEVPEIGPESTAAACTAILEYYDDGTAYIDANESALAEGDETVSGEALAAIRELREELVSELGDVALDLEDREAVDAFAELVEGENVGSELTYASELATQAATFFRKC